MAKISVNIPPDKMQSFLLAIINLGIDTRSILSKRYRKTIQQKRQISNSLMSMLFGWEYYSNELEFE